MTWKVHMKHPIDLLIPGRLARAPAKDIRLPNAIQQHFFG
jgi:hypothetical protein